MNRRLWIFAFVLSGVASPLCANETEGTVTLGVWSWSQDAIATQSARERLLDFCVAEGITHVDQHVSMRRVDGKLSLQNASKLSKLLAEASARGISVSALRGEKSMFFAAGHQRRLEEIAVLMDFNRSQPDDARLWGLKYDVEPYLTDEWKEGGATRRRCMEEYLECLEKIRAKLTASQSRLRFSVDVPFWLDRENLTLARGGVTKAFVHHIQDHVDSIAIMSYRRSAGDVMRFCEQELDYASKAGGRVAPGLNFNRATGVEKVTTFAGHPSSEYRHTLDELRKRYSGNPAVRLIMLHDYKNLSSYLGKE